MKKIILLNGQIGIGKSYIADKIVEKYDAKKESFAGELKYLSLKILQMLSNSISSQAVYGNSVDKMQKVYIHNVFMIPSVIKLVYRYLQEHNICPYKSQTNYLNVTKILTELLTKEYVTPREVMQLVGTEIIRDNIDKDFHVKSVQQRINNSPYKIFVIDDYRFINEYQGLANVDKLALVIKRDNDVKYNHSSENGIIYQDKVVDIGSENVVEWHHVQPIIDGFLK